jgi:hypothetical protein
MLPHVSLAAHAHLWKSVLSCRYCLPPRLFAKAEIVRRNGLYFARARCKKPVIALCRDIKSALLVALFYLAEHGERSYRTSSRTRLIARCPFVYSFCRTSCKTSRTLSKCTWYYTRGLFNTETASSVQAAATAIAACCLVAHVALRTLSYYVLSWGLKRQCATQCHQ